MPGTEPALEHFYLLFEMRSVGLPNGNWQPFVDYDRVQVTELPCTQTNSKLTRPQAYAHNFHEQSISTESGPSEHFNGNQIYLEKKEIFLRMLICLRLKNLFSGSFFFSNFMFASCS